MPKLTFIACGLLPPPTRRLDTPTSTPLRLPPRQGYCDVIDHYSVLDVGGNHFFSSCFFSLVIAGKLDYLIEGDEGLTVWTNDVLGDYLSDTVVLSVMILVMLAAMIYSRYKMELTTNLIRTTARIINYIALTKKELDQLQECLTSTNTMANEVEDTHMDVRQKLLHLGREYPQGYDYFRARLKRAFSKNRDVVKPDQIELLLSHGQFVVKELEALYMLRKYRTLKKRYYHDR
uniref:Uncharacterized protein n=1 Tax=Timema tahoe TaxID=61484 RepID=A0A7R9IGA1_9NEOP|nr:unnamed protein product [Timema tahoe]